MAKVTVKKPAPSQKSGKKKIGKIVLVILLTLVLAGGSFFASYYYFNQKAQADQDELNKQIDEKTKEVEELEDLVAALNKQLKALKGIPEAEIEKDPTATWKTYTNDKYDYQFKYPPEYIIAADNSKTKSIAEDKDSNVTLQGDLSNIGWPMIQVSHYNSKLYNIPSGKDLLTWLKQNIGESLKDTLPNSYNYTIKTTGGNTIQAVRAHSPQSPQAYSQDEIYFVHKSKMLCITLLDIDNGEAFYTNWLSAFRAID